MNLTIILSYLFFFVAASASPLQRRWLSIKEDVSHKGQIHFAYNVMLIVSVMGLVLPFIEPFKIQGNIIDLVGLSLACGVFGAGFFMASYTAQRHVEAGVSTIVNNIYTPVTIILATIFLSENLRAIQIGGTALLLVGMLVVSKKHKIGKFKFDKHFMLMLLSGVMLGVALTAERALQKVTGFTAGTLFSWWIQCAFLGLAALMMNDRCTYSNKDIAITGVLRFLQSLSWVVLIYIVGNLSIVSAITTFKVVIIFVAAAIFLKERENMQRKILGSLVALAGLLLMG